MAAPASPELAPPDRPPGDTSETRPKVIYVMGAGRSGSTILGIALGNCANVFYAGELDAWLARSGVPQLEEGAERLAFWREVRQRAEAATQALPGLYGREAQRSIERSMALFRPHLWASRRRLRGPYQAVSEAVYEAVAGVSGAPCIVDSSHYPLRARELQALDGIELYLLYLLREPDSVVASFNRTDVAQYSKSTLTTNVYLWLTNLLSVSVFLRQPRARRVVVRYEQFIANPVGVLSDLLQRAGLPAEMPADLAALNTGVPFQGNRVIAAGTVALSGGAPARARGLSLTRVLQAPWRLTHALLRPVAAGAPSA